MTISSDRLSVLLGASIIPQVMELLGIDTADAAADFYASETYDLLADTRTDLWHLSPATLAFMYRTEREEGVVPIPEEQS